MGKLKNNEFGLDDILAIFKMTYKKCKIGNKIRLLGSKFVKRNLNNKNCFLYIENNHLNTNIKEFHLVDEKEE